MRVSFPLRRLLSAMLMSQALLLVPGHAFAASGDTVVELDMPTITRQAHSDTAMDSRGGSLAHLARLIKARSLKAPGDAELARISRMLDSQVSDALPAPSLDAPSLLPPVAPPVSGDVPQYATAAKVKPHSATPPAPAIPFASKKDIPAPLPVKAGKTATARPPAQPVAKSVVAPLAAKISAAAPTIKVVHANLHRARLHAPKIARHTATKVRHASHAHTAKAHAHPVKAHHAAKHRARLHAHRIARHTAARTHLAAHAHTAKAHAHPVKAHHAAKHRARLHAHRIARHTAARTHLAAHAHTAKAHAHPVKAHHAAKHRARLHAHRIARHTTARTHHAAHAHTARARPVKAHHAQSAVRRHSALRLVEGRAPHKVQHKTAGDAKKTVASPAPASAPGQSGATKAATTAEEANDPDVVASLESENSIPALEAARRLDPDNHAVVDRLSAHYAEDGRYAEASNRLLTVIADDSVAGMKDFLASQAKEADAYRQQLAKMKP
ncbi:hypothetical protein [Paludibacterium paludis]|uniref:Uncharacterized protein n=1 Tax=Paludibacterium paludis TaxID=1225769 RepID=A0A918P5C9_9NEIS|nr:hypothetical protein [Paludibacterium paludis]GGY20839.1 hypothetical protein GCM10011289_25600 [Paludibacterium paludis]